MKPLGSDLADDVIDGVDESEVDEPGVDQPEVHEAPAAARLTERDRLTEREEQILAFERKWWKHAGSKEQAIRDAFDLSATRYYQVLNSLLDNPAALAHDPVLVGRLRRLRATRARARRG